MSLFIERSHRFINRLSCRFCAKDFVHYTLRSSFTSKASHNGGTTPTSQHHDHNVPHASYIESITKSHVVKTINELEISIIHKYLRGYSRFQSRLLFVVISGLGIGALAIYLLREPIKENLSDEVADVATRSLGDESVVMKANEITRIVLKDLVNDPSTHIIVSQFIFDILQNVTVQNGAIQLAKHIINDEGTRIQVNQLVILTIENLLKDEVFCTLIQDYIKDLLAQPEIYKSCQMLIKSLADDDSTKEMLSILFKNVIASDQVTSQAIHLGKEVTNNVISDVKIQKDGGNALWNIGLYSVIPSWFLRK